MEDNNLGVQSIGYFSKVVKYYDDENKTGVLRKKDLQLKKQCSEDRHCTERGDTDAVFFG